MVPVAPSTQTRWRNFKPDEAGVAAAARERVDADSGATLSMPFKMVTVELA
jgi:hypothetical protein